MGGSYVSHERECTAHTYVKQEESIFTPVKTIAERLKAARDEAGLNQVELARRAGVAPGTIGNIEAGTRQNPRELLEIAAAVGVRAEWLKTGFGPRTESGLAQSLSHHAVTLPPRRLEWGDVVKAKMLPSEFQVEVPDDACAPEVRAGWSIQCSTTVSPVPGDHVIVRDAQGVTFFRLYAEGAGGTWEAQATGRGYRSLNSDADGLVLLAVVMFTMRPRGA